MEGEQPTGYVSRRFRPECGEEDADDTGDVKRDWDIDDEGELAFPLGVDGMSWRKGTGSIEWRMMGLQRDNDGEKVGDRC